MKTPTVYSGIRLVTLPAKSHHQQAATAARKTIAVGEGQAVAPEGELVGQEAVAGHRLARRGKSAKAVFAARISRPVVANWSR